MSAIQSWTCELGYGADTMFHRTYFLFSIKLIRRCSVFITGPPTHSVGEPD